LPPASLRPARLTAFLLCLLVLAAPAAAQTPLTVESAPLRLNPEDATQQRVGALRWRGGLVLSAQDPRFGGLSDLDISADGRRLTAITDEGRWLTARLAYDSAGHLAGLSEVRWGALRDPRGLLLTEKRLQDAEGLTRLADGSLVVAFERDHRLRRFPGGDLARPPQEIAAPPGLAAADSNGGLEALVVLAGDRLLGFTEGQEIGDSYAVYLRDTSGQWQGLALKPKGLFYPTGAAQLPDGDVLLLERRFTLLGGLSARLSRLPLASIQPGALLQGREIAELRPPLTLDNFEGVAVHQLGDGTTRITLLSDDNFSTFQRSLLVQFELLD
jgi:hypothetical protein